MGLKLYGRPMHSGRRTGAQVVDAWISAESLTLLRPRPAGSRSDSAERGAAPGRSVIGTARTRDGRLPVVATRTRR